MAIKLTTQTVSMDVSSGRGTLHVDLPIGARHVRSDVVKKENKLLAGTPIARPQTIVRLTFFVEIPSEKETRKFIACDAVGELETPVESDQGRTLSLAPVDVVNTGSLLGALMAIYEVIDEGPIKEPPFA